MKGQIRLTAILLTLISATAMLVLAGCPQRQMPGPGPGPQPEVDPTAFEPANEFRFLVDIDGGINRMLEAQNVAVGGDESDLEEMKEEIGAVFQQGNVTAEANATTVRAHGEYNLDFRPIAQEIGVEFAMFSPLGFLAEAGTATVGLQTHLSADRWVAHLFVANPGELTRMGLDAFIAFMAGRSGTGAEDERILEQVEAFLRMSLGVDEISEVYEWMGDELVLTLLVNPDFDPDAIPEMKDLGPREFFGNLPVYPLLAISTDQPEEALDLIQGIADNILMMNGMAIELERTELGRFDALMLPVDDLADQIGFYSEEGRAEFVAVMEEAGPSVAVAVEGYVLVGAMPALEAALDAFRPQSTGEGRTATVELAWNWDYLIDAYTTSRDAYVNELAEMREFEDIQEIMVRFDEEVMGLDELGMAYISAVVQDGENFDLDIRTSRESIRLLGLMQEVFEESMATWTGMIEGEYTQAWDMDDDDKWDDDADDEDEEGDIDDDDEEDDDDDDEDDDDDHSEGKPDDN